jgi:hypothetical protein
MENTPDHSRAKGADAGLEPNRSHPFRSETNSRRIRKGLEIIAVSIDEAAGSGALAGPDWGRIAVGRRFVPRPISNSG